MRLGVFGGTFDPVHLGHLLLADCCREQARLDRVLFIPAAHQPHKPHPPVAAGAQRLQMLHLALSDRPTFAASSIELDRGGVSYTVDTLRDIEQRDPAAELFFLMGADSLADLPKWREPAAICRIATPLVVRRAGCDPPDYEALEGLLSAARIAEIRAVEVAMPPTPISSSLIRRLVAEGGDWRPLTLPAVADFIQSERLYDAK